MRRFLVYILLGMLPTALYGREKLSLHTRFYLEQAADGRQQLPSADGCIPAFVLLADEGDPAALEAAGVAVGTVAGDCVTARIPISRMDDIVALDDVKYIDMGTPAITQMDEAKACALADKMQQGTDLPQEYRGTGIVIGVVDNGFDYGHPNFMDRAKEKLRIQRVWDQNGTGNAPEGFSYGTEYSTPEEILQTGTDTDDATHGTHVLGIAAGADQTDGHNYCGVATDADIVLVALNQSGLVAGDNTAVIDGINYIYRYAEAQGKPCVVNISLGSHLGPRDGTSAFDRMADALQGEGRLLVGSVGNEGNMKYHIAKNLKPQECDTLKTFLDFTYSYPQHTTVELWGDAGMEYSIIPILYDKSTQQALTAYAATSISATHAGDTIYRFDTPADYLPGRLEVKSEISPYNDKPHMMLTIDCYTTDEYLMGFGITSTSGGCVHGWTDNTYSQFSNHGISGYDDGNAESSMGELGGSGKRIISVGAYTSRDHRTQYGIYYPSGETLGDIVSFSSHGPTPDGRVKPDITAPGSYIVSSLSSYYTGSKTIATTVTYNGQKYDFGYMHGSSMASPFVAGCLAAWMQVYDDMTPEQAKEILAATAIEDSYTGSLPATGDNRWGHGKIDAWNGIKECIRLKSAVEAPLSRQNAIVTQAGGECRIVLTQAAQHATIRLIDLNGRPLHSISLKDTPAMHEYDIPMHNLPSGIYVIEITGDNCRMVKKIAL